MYTPFVIYLCFVVVILALIISSKARRMFVAVVLCAVLFAGLLALHGAARAEAPQERTCWVEEIHICPDYIVVTDEDGFKWPIPFWEEMNVSIGEEHTLYVDLTAENQWGRTYWLDEEVTLK